MRMSVTIEVGDTVLSARTEVHDQNEAKKLAGDLYAQVNKIATRGEGKAVLKLLGWSKALKSEDVLERLIRLLGVDDTKARHIVSIVKKKSPATVFEGTFDACTSKELELRDYGFRATVERVNGNGG